MSEGSTTCSDDTTSALYEPLGASAPNPTPPPPPPLPPAAAAAAAADLPWLEALTCGPLRCCCCFWRAVLLLLLFLLLLLLLGSMLLLSSESSPSLSSQSCVSAASGRVFDLGFFFLAYLKHTQSV